MTRRTGEHESSNDPATKRAVDSASSGRGRSLRTGVCWLAVLALAVSSPSWAGPVTLTFSFDGLANGASNALIQSYMRTQSGDAALNVSGAIASRTYTADGHVVGPTLSTSPTDTFIMNNGPGSNSFSIDFGSMFYISSISFDWEIFPDISCQAHSTCASHGSSDPNWPDFNLYVDGGVNPVFSQVGTQANANVDPQAIGTSGLILLSNGHSLLFADWPAEIAIDNLVVNGCFSTTPGVSCLQRDKVPEPPTLLLAGLGLAMLGFARRRSRTHA